MSPAWKLKTSLSTAVFASDTPIEQMLAEAAGAGFDAVEPVITGDNPSIFDLDEPECIEIANRAQKAGLGISGVSLEDALETNLSSPDDAVRNEAINRILTAMDRAVWLGADVLIVIPGVVGIADSSAPLITYEEAYVRSLEALLELRFEAQRRSVHIACVAGANRFLLSPMETRSFMDRINSPWVRVCLDPSDILRIGYPQDWVRSLGHRVACVRFKDIRLRVPSSDSVCNLGDGDVPWSEVVRALHEVGYRGSATYYGVGTDLIDTKTRLEGILRL